MKLNQPWCEFPCSPDDLVGAVSFGDIETVAAEIGVSAQQLAYWRRGREPVPRVVYLYLRHRSETILGAQYGPFQGFRLCDRGDALVCPGTGIRVNHAEIARLPEYRRAQRLASDQAELIERLMIERDFYRKNCHRQARFGMLLNRLLDDD
ncbi:hypothetical protein [Chromobacterium violaceum]|uniref:hypothetical protein n=1 Tax=Chromobacterium violaceum TaxID=536 RepID=UPI00194E2396|nr:hypothetical protein [Chromobacterium violaceum]QRO33899.1 hypothetical protein I6K04_03925 [Chromobacterium violaceum]QRQ16297.1 hypothetical protein I6K03_18805 [Chromobacterium violaceum]